MPCERKHIEAIEEAARKLMPGEPCHESACEDCQDDRALLDAIHDALAACDESPWRSMESAPGVGVVVLLWAPSHARRPIEGFLSTSGIWWNMRGHEVQFPTHWMPLPAAPEVKP